METTTAQQVSIGTRLEVYLDYTNSPYYHFRTIGSEVPLCGATISRPWVQALAVVVSSQLLQVGTNMHRLKAKTDCFQCMLALRHSLHAPKEETAGAS
jgi:hypothetical protein